MWKLLLSHMNPIPLNFLNQNTSIHQPVHPKSLINECTPSGSNPQPHPTTNYYRRECQLSYSSLALKCFINERYLQNQIIQATQKA